MRVKEKEFIYILTNPAMPDWIKVGRTDNLQERINSLSNTSVPFRFECYAYLEVPSEYVVDVEAGLHKQFNMIFDHGKEFFRTSPEIIFNHFETLLKYNKQFKLIREPDLDTEEEKKWRKKTTFELLQIEPGTVLVCTKDKDLKCIVADKNNSVTVCGTNDLTTLSALINPFYKTTMNGFKYFTLENDSETLWERRLRLEKK